MLEVDDEFDVDLSSLEIVLQTAVKLFLMVIEAKNPGAITRGHLYELGQIREEFLVVEGAWVSCSLVFGFKQFLLVLSHLREDFVKTAAKFTHLNETRVFITQ